MSSGATTELHPALEALQPLEKSWYANLGLADLIVGNDRTVRSLDAYPKPLPHDVLHMRESSRLILAGEKDIPVGEGGACARKLTFASAIFGWGLRLHKAGSLKDRPDEFTPDMVQWSLKDLGTVNKDSSQLASASVMCGNVEPIPDNAAYHLKLAHEAREHWQNYPSDKPWDIKLDRTIRRHSVAYVGWLATGIFNLEMIQPEDYAIGRVFQVATPQDAINLGWSSLEGHESSRLVSVDEAIAQATAGEEVTLIDHRPLQALRMRYGYGVRFANIQAISKSWPLIMYNAFLAEANELNRQSQTLET